MIRLQPTWSVIVTLSTATSSCGESRPWGFAKSSSPPARPGNILAFDKTAGIAQGNAVANFVFDNAFRPLPQ
jgi:hypothetical protein